jgi:hypothetical protein
VSVTYGDPKVTYGSSRVKYNGETSDTDGSGAPPKVKRVPAKPAPATPKER